MSSYDIRPFEPADRDDFLALYRTVMGGEPDEHWFDWKYASNPFAEGVPMIVATTDGSLVGARPFFALPIAVNGATEIAYQPADTMVHPAHRRQGLFTRMTERSLSTFPEACALFFNFPNHRSRPGYLKLDWEVVTERTAYYRIANPAAVAAAESDRPAIRLAGTVLTPPIRAYYRLTSMRQPAQTAYTIRREQTLPVDELIPLYKKAIPRAFHARRTAAFIEWRFRNPQWEYTTYIAEDAAEPVAAIVTATSERQDALQRTRITDMLPLQDPPHNAVRLLMHRILEDHADADLFIASSDTIPEEVLRAFGFRPDDSRALSSFTQTTTHVARALDDDWTVHDLNITDPANWMLTSVETDTA